MDKKYMEGNNSSHKKDTSSTKGKHPLHMISAGLSKRQADKLAKLGSK